MSLGMSYTDYWEGENSLPGFFIQAYNQRRRREMEEQNFNAWLGGFYNMQAFAVVLSNAFAKKGSPPAEYPDKSAPAPAPPVKSPPHGRTEFSYPRSYSDKSPQA